MDISKLKARMRVKNYKALCELLGVKVKTGEAKKNHLLDFARYAEYKREGNSFIILKILPTPEARVDKRKIKGGIGNNRKHFKQFNIPIELENKKGVYKIMRENDVYIGSTFANKGFRERFRRHMDETNKMRTRDMLLQGGIFESIWICDDNLEDEYIVREMEGYIINYFKENTTLNVVNNRDKTYITRQTPNTNKNKPDKKEKYSTIKIKAKLEDYARIIQVLNENNIEFTEHKKKGVKNGYK